MTVDKWNTLNQKGRDICVALGLPSSLIDDLGTEPSDWAFILKVDSLLEMASRTLIAKTLRIEIGGKLFGGPKMEKFAAKIPTVGRSSLRDLLEIAGCPSDRMRFLDAVRHIRNAYAHDISTCGETILSMALRDQNPRRILLAMSAVEEAGYDYDAHVVMIMEDAETLRFGILYELLTFLGMSFRQWASGETPG